MVVQDIRNESEFNTILEHTSGLIVCDFFATWCGPCRVIAPKYDAMSQEFKDVMFLRVDSDKCKRLAQSQGVSALPTFKFYANKTSVGQVKGADANKLRQMIETLSVKYPKKSKFQMKRGGGYSLTGNLPAQSSPASSSSAPQTKAKRHNPWANPAFVSKMTKTKVIDDTSSKPKPVEAKKAIASSRSSSNRPRDVIPSAKNNVQAKPKSTPPAAVSSTPAAQGGEVNELFLQQLLAMGFDEQKTRNALRKTKNVSLDAALMVLTTPEAEEDTPMPNASESAPTGEANAPSDAKDAAAEPAEQVSDAAMIDEDPVDEGMQEVINNMKKQKELEAKKAAKANPQSKISLSASALAGKSHEEKMAIIQQKRDAAKKKKEAEQLAVVKAREKSRQQIVKASVSLARKQEQTEADMIARQRKKAAADKKAQKARLKAKEAERKAKAKEAAEKRRLELERIRAAKQAK